MLKETKSSEEMCAVAEEVLTIALGQRRAGSGALVFALCGELGSGKTTFTQGVAGALGVQESVISPTFILERVYKLRRGEFTHLVHIDCYRLDDDSELRALGWDNLVKDPKNIILVEWAERIKSALPKDAIEICFEHTGENKRKILVTFSGSQSEKA